MKLLSLDMSLSSTGYCLSEVDFDKVGNNLGAKILNLDESEFLGWNILDCGEIKEEKEVKKLLAKVRKSLKSATEDRGDLLDLEHKYETERIKHQINEITKIVNNYLGRIDYVFIEDYNYHGPGSVTQLAELRGFLKILLEKLKYSDKIKHIRYIPIQSIKKIIGMHGHADKQLIREGLLRFGQEINEKEVDKSDAIAINITGFLTLCYMKDLVTMPTLKDKKDTKIAKSYLESLEKITNRI